MPTVPLIDSRIVAQAFAMRRVVQHPQALAAAPVIPDAQAYGSVLRDHNDRWRAWYLGSPVYSGYYAESNDGLTWQRPALDLVAPEVRPETNGPNAFLSRNQRDAAGRWLVGSQGPEGFAVLDNTVTPHPAAKGRFTALYLARTETEQGMYVAHSDDGVRWLAEEANPVIDGWRDTSSCLFHDARIGRYVWYGRPAAYAAAEMHANRLVARKESEDLIHWSPERTVLDTDDADADPWYPIDEAALRAGKDTATAEERAAAWAALTEGQKQNEDLPLVRGRNRQWYGITAFPWAGLYLGIAWMYDLPSGDMWTELLHSYDGIDWRREPGREPFIERIPGTCTCTMASPPVMVDGTMRFYDSIQNRNHHGVPNPNVQRGIRAFTLPRDRWVGYQAGDVQGELLTQILPRPADIRLNVATEPDGWIAVEVADAEGRPLRGMTRAEAVPITGDHLAIRPQWTSGQSPEELPESAIRLRIHARRASLYALEV